MADTLYDALIIGGGPGGSCAATCLARAGKRALVLEKERFPRFHIGESLLPYNHQLFQEIGVLQKLEAAGFVTKYGAQFHLGNSSKCLKLIFKSGRFTRSPVAFQVERSKFDHILLTHARESGAETREGWTVNKFTHAPDGVSIEARDEAGRTETFRGRFLIDASGRGNFTGNVEGTRRIHPQLKKIAIFGHFEGVKVEEGPKAGDIVIVRLDDKWFWLIPISPKKVSVGCVMDQQEFARSGEAPAELFARIWKSSSELQSRMNDARPVGAIQTTSDFSYYNDRLIGPRLMRIGDAAGFMDPIFSAGVYLAMFSGKLAAEVIADAVAGGNNGSSGMRAYEKRMFRAMRYYGEMVELFYTKPFIELFMQPRPKFHIPDAIVAILAGELEGGWKLEWRRKMFFWLVKAQARWPLVPRISFEDRVAPCDG